MKFNPEEISLCKQIAEKYKKEVEYGSQFIWNDETPVLASCNMKQRKDLIPLWTISDCLEFFKEREHTLERAYQLAGIFHVIIISSSKKAIIEGIGDTLLTACLKAVLAVLEEE